MLSHDLRVPCLGFDRIKLCSRKGVVETLIHPQDNVEWGFCIDSSLKGRILVEPFQHRSALNNDFQHLIGCGSEQRRFFAFAMRAMTLLSITLIKYQILAHTGWRAMLLSCFWLRFQHFSTCMIFACLPHEEVNVQLHAVWLHRSLHRKSWAFICECAARILFLFVAAFVVFPLQRFEIWSLDENWLSERYISSLQGWSIRTLSWTFRGPVKARQFHIPFGEPAADEEAARAKQMTSRTLTKARYSFFLSCWRG